MHKHYDQDGLLFANEIGVMGKRLFLDGREIFIAAECRGVADYLLEHYNLWEISRLRVSHLETRMKRAPIIGIPFSSAFKWALNCRVGLKKSMFQIPNWTKYKGKAVVATMIAHTAATSKTVELQAWQILDVSPETFYIHAIIDKVSLTMVHLDAATMLHTAKQQADMVNHARKIKGASYEKQFRLDGNISLRVAMELINLYLPIEKLTKEFVGAIGPDA